MNLPFPHLRALLRSPRCARCARCERRGRPDGEAAARRRREAPSRRSPGGCFWCMEQPFDKQSTACSPRRPGYIGGTKANPTYEEVSSGGTGHAEAVQVLYDPKKVSYEKLLDVFWHNIDPTVKDRQFCDVGTPVPDRDLRARRRAAHAPPKHRRPRSRSRSRSRNRSSRRSSRRPTSGPPRNTTRTTT